MKTQRVKFIDSGRPVATAVGTFDTLPGTGPVIWSGEWVRNPPLVFDDGLPDHGYAGDFVEAMSGIAKMLGVTVEVEETGDWDVYFE